MHRNLLLVIAILTGLLLACQMRVPFLSSSSPVPTPTQTDTATPTPPSQVAVNVTVVYPSPTATDTPTVTITPTPSPLPTDPPPPPPTDTPTSTPTVTPAQIAVVSVSSSPQVPPTATPEFVGEILLEEPIHNLLMPVKVRDFEFKWYWTGRNDCILPTEYAFEVRIWPPAGSPMAAMDAIAERDKIYCDPVSGLWSYTVPNLKDAPGPMSVAVETAATGPYLWNVALMRTYPVIEAAATASPRSFTIPGDYVGPYDTTRATVTCLNFNVWLEAQALYLATGGPVADLNNLDPDGNGIACDELRPQ